MNTIPVQTYSTKTLFESIKIIEPIINEYMDIAEKERRLSQPVVDAIKTAGLYSIWAPKLFGGLEMDPMVAFKIFEEIAYIDSAAGWNLQLSSAIHPFLAWLPEEGSEEIYSRGSDVIMGGALFPPGKAKPVEDGYILSGRWPFVSGCHNCSWYMAPSFIMDKDDLKLGENNQPIQMLVFFSFAEIDILDTWNTIGMRGTGSHDVVAKEIFIPQRRAAILAPLENPGKGFEGPLYRMTCWPPIAALAPPALGIARAAIDEFIDLAKTKKPFYTTIPLRERREVQSQIAKAKALNDAARAYLYEAMSEGWDNVAAGQRLELEQKMKIQSATSFAIRSAANAVDLIFEFSGTSAIKNKHLLQKHFRDIHTITQHAHGSTSRYQSIGRLMLGLDMDWAFFAL